MWEDEEDIKKENKKQQEEQNTINNNKEVIPGSKDVVDDSYSVKSFAAQMVEDFLLPVKTTALESKEKFWDTWGQKYINQFNGDKEKAKAEADKVYNVISKQYETLAFKEKDTQFLENMAYMADGIKNIEYIGEDYKPDISLTNMTASGKLQILDEWSGSMYDLRGTQLDAKTFIDADGNLVDYSEDDIYDLTYNPKYADSNGRQIKAFIYEPADEYSRDPKSVTVRAIYEGEEIPYYSETVSRLDSSDSFLRGNLVNNSNWKIFVGSAYNFLIDVVDTALTLQDNMYSFITLGATNLTPIGDWTQEGRDFLKTLSFSKSQKDKESFFTLGNAIDLGVNVGLQLLSGKLAASGGAKLLGLAGKYSEALISAEKEVFVLEQKLSQVVSKAAKLGIEKELSTARKALEIATKQYNSRANIVKKITLGYMGAMQAKETSDVAKANGFNDFESSLIFFASLGAMAWVNKLSDLGFERLGLEAAEDIARASAKDALIGVTASKTGVRKVFNKLPEIFSNTTNRLRSAVKSFNPVMENITREAFEEESEYIVDQLVRHAANAYSTIKYGYFGDGTKKEQPKFLSVSDPGYWDNFLNESVMNVIGGALGGAMGGVGELAFRSKSNAVNEDELLQRGKTAENMKKLAYFSKRSINGKMEYDAFMNELDNLRETGYFGREDISNLWMPEENRFKRTEELTEEDKKKGYMSQSEFHYLATKGQMMFYQNIALDPDLTLEEMLNSNQDLDFMLNSETAFEESKKLFEESAAIYSEMNIPKNVNLNDELTEMAELKSKIDSKTATEKDKTEYSDKVSKLAEVSGVQQDKIVRLVEITKGISDIKSGKAIQLMFIKHSIKNGGFKNLSFDVLKNLIGIDIQAQDDFAETKKNLLKAQDDVAKTVLEMLKANNMELSQEIVDLVAESSVMDEDTKTMLIEVIENYGTTLHAKKVALIEKIYKDNADVFNSLNSEQFKKYFDIDEDINITEVLDQFLNFIKSGNTDIRSILKTDTQLAKILNSNLNHRYDYSLENHYSDVSSDKDLPEDLEFLKALYIMHKMYDIAKKDAFEKIEAGNFDIDAVKNIDVNISMLIGNMVDYGIWYVIEDDLIAIGENRTKQILPELYGPIESGTYESILDKDAEFKNEFISHIKSLPTVNPETPRNDLVSSFNNANNNSLSKSNKTLEQEVSDLLKLAILDNNGNIQYFSDVDKAEGIKTKILTRLEENVFLLNSIQMLNTLDDLHKTILKNDERPETFLTTYLNKYVFDLGTLEDNYDEIVSEFNSNIAKLSNLSGIVDSLIAKAASSSEDLQQIYIKDAYESLLKKFTDINTIISKLLPGVDGDEKTQLESIKKSYNDFTSDDNIASAESLIALSEMLNNTKVVLHNIYNSNKSKFISLVKKVTNINDKDRIRNFLLATMSPVKEMNNRLHDKLVKVIDLIKNDPEKINGARPWTVPQLNWIEEAVTAVYDENYLSTIKELGSDDIDTNIITFSGAQGTGKTRIIAGEVADILTSIYGNDSKVLVSSNKAEQVNILRSNVNVATKSIAGNNVITKETLLELFKSDNAAKELEDVSVIIYDEIAHMSYFTDESINEQGELNLILSKLEEINKQRDKNNKLIIIGLGDSEQPGFIYTPKNNAKNANPMEQNVFSVGASRLIYKSNTRLTRNFRSKIVGLDDYIKSLDKSLTSTVVNMTGKKVTIQFPISTYNIKDGSHFGFRIQKKSFKEMLDDGQLVNDIKTKIEASKSEDKEFKVILITGLDSADQTKIESTKFYKEILDDVKYKDNVKILSFSEVQGDEADYVLVDIDQHFFSNVTQDNIEKADIDPNIRPIYMDRVKKLLMSMGRAYTFTDIAFQPDIHIYQYNKEGDVEMKSSEQSDDFKKVWLNALDEMLKLGGQVVQQPNTGTSSTTKKETKPKAGSTQTVSAEVKGGLSFSKFIRNVDLSKYTEVHTLHNVSGRNVSKINMLLGDTYKHLHIDDFSKDTINTLISNIKREKENTNNMSEKGKLANILSDIASFVEEFYGKSEENLETINQGAVSLNTTDEYSSDKDFMMDLEREKKSVVFYSYLSDNSIKSENNNKIQYYIETMYGKGTQIGKMSDAISYNDKNELEINVDQYDYVITHTAHKNNSGTIYYDHFITAKHKETKAVILLGRIAVNSLSEGQTKWFLKKFQEYLSDNYDNLDQIDGRVKIESKILMPQVLIQGLTVGSVVEASKAIKEAMKDDFDVANKIPSRLIRSNQNRNLISKLNSLKTKKNGYPTWENVDFNIVKQSDLFVKYNGMLIIDDMVFIKTSKGIVPFKFDRGVWTPVIGFLNNKAITEPDITKSQNVLYDAELTQISKILIGLDKYVTKDFKLDKPDDVEWDNIIKQIGFEDRSKTSDVLDESSVKPALVQTYLKWRTNYLGEYRIKFDKAKRLMSKTGGPASFSMPAVITEGVHKGKSFVLYTFRNDLNLNNMDAKEIERLYVSMIKNNNDEDSILSINQNGVGVLLLDNPTKSLSELLEIAINNTSTSYLDFNKITLSSTSEKELISLFSVLYKKLFGNETEFIQKLISESENAKYYHDIVKEWISKNGNNDTLVYVKNILREMFKSDNMGVPVLELNIDDDTALFFGEVETARIKYENDDAEFNKRVDELKHNYRNKVDSSLLGLNNYTLVSLITKNKDTTNDSGYFLLDKNNKLVLTRNNKTVITAFDNTSNAIQESQVPATRFDLYRFLTLIGKTVHETMQNHTEFNSTVSDMLNIFNDLITSTPKFLHGINMSPIVETSDSVIEIIHDSEQAEKMLETTVKQIRTPAVVINTDNLTNTSVVEELSQSSTSAENTSKSIIDELLKRAATITQGSSVEEILKDVEDSALDAEAKAELTEKIFAKYYEEAILVHINLDNFTKYKLDAYMLKIRPEIKQSIDLLNSIFSIYTPKVKTEFKSLIDLILKTGNFYESEVNFIYNILELLDDHYTVNEMDADAALGDIMNSNKQFIEFVKENLTKEGDFSMSIYPIMKSADILTKLHLIIEGEQYEQNSSPEIDKWIAKIGEQSNIAGARFDLDNFANNSIETFNAMLNTVEDPKEYIGLLEKLYNTVTPHMKSESTTSFVGKLAELVHNKFNTENLDSDTISVLNNFYNMLGTKQIATTNDVITKYVDLKTRIELFNSENEDVKLDDTELELFFNALNTLEFDSINNLFLKEIGKSGNAMTEFATNLYDLNNSSDDQLTDDSLDKIGNFISEISQDFDKKCTIKII